MLPFDTGLFLTRIEWQLDNFNLPRELIDPAFAAIAQPLEAKWQLHLFTLADADVFYS
ncbi:hypothetical protein MC7420_6206 [Coleofasciculus chthonoplastes PCC 7420]|uniref:Uncharacterized protein n=1 Tax=Coleofasciculus chthonoplastes PCC 7420 TaxID=118168 RepID=B4VU49_9CYAN|nr:hypothetical protein MC7420_6206 [Coleofasciculus chthonoplastes PCC 7420]